MTIEAWLWVAFFAGCGWVMLGMAVLARLDPNGEYDGLVMGECPNVTHYGLTLMVWPVVAFFILGSSSG